MSQDFRFKRFSVKNERSGLKVGTDGVLLGALATVHAGMHNILDIGTGTGLIALMLAQRCSDIVPQATITAIDIDEDAAAEASDNFAASPWSHALKACHASLQDFESKSDISMSSEPSLKYDLIVCNPPFFENSLKNPDEKKSIARHTDSLSYRDVIAFALAHLADNGRVAMVLPKDVQKDLARYAGSFGLKVAHIVDIRTTAAKAPKRMVIEFGKIPVAPIEEVLTIQENGAYTGEFLALTHEFYLFA